MEAIVDNSYSLNPFDDKQQQDLLKEFWMQVLNVKDATQREKIVKFPNHIQFLKYFHGLNLLKKECFVGIALQTRMLVDIFQDECKKYLQRGQINSNDFGITNIFDLYKRFIENQYNRYLGKIYVNKLSKGSQTLLTRLYTKAYGYLALKSLFSEDQIHKELPSKDRFSGEGLQDIGLIRNLKDDGTADFHHPTYAEYFVADFLVNALKKKNNHAKYRAVDKFLLMQMFRDDNKVILSFVRNKIEKENNSDLSSKWKALEDRDLLGEVENRIQLQFESSSLGPDHLNTLDDDQPEESLGDLQQEVERYMDWKRYGRVYGYFYDNNKTDFIEKLFQKFFKETDIKALESTLVFLLNANGKSHLTNANNIFSLENNIGKAVTHYLTEVKRQDMTRSLKHNLTFMKKLVPFVKISVDENKKLPFTPETLETTLELFKDILQGHPLPKLAESESIEFLFVLEKAGLKIIDIQNGLLVLDPAGKYEHSLELPSDNMGKIKELLKLKVENAPEPLKRRGSESERQESKRLRV